jgi:hypothetical protein
MADEVEPGHPVVLRMRLAEIDQRNLVLMQELVEIHGAGPSMGRCGSPGRCCAG